MKNTKIRNEIIISAWFILGGGDGFWAFFFGVVFLSASPPALFQYLQEVYEKDENGLFTEA